jgi:hypothetical protein
MVAILPEADREERAERSAAEYIRLKIAFQSTCGIGKCTSRAAEQPIAGGVYHSGCFKREPTHGRHTFRVSFNDDQGESSWPNLATDLSVG